VAPKTVLLADWRGYGYGWVSGFKVVTRSIGGIIQIKISKILEAIIINLARNKQISGKLLYFSGPGL
jgi:hypothetical protein